MPKISLHRLGSGAGFRISDAQGRPLAYIYGYRDRSSAQSDMLSYEEAERVAILIARLLANQNVRPES